MATLFLIRHAEPLALGVDVGLSPRGHEQAKQLGSLGAVSVYSSPLQRALESAAHLSVQPTILTELREIGLGDWTGKPWREIEATWPELARRKLGDWLNVTPPNGESWPAALQRADDVIRIVRTQSAAPTAIVAHQGINAAIANRIAGTDPLTFHQNYAEVIRLDVP